MSEKGLELRAKLSKFELEQLLKGKIDFVEIQGLFLAGVPLTVVVEAEKSD